MLAAVAAALIVVPAAGAHAPGCGSKKCDRYAARAYERHHPMQSALASEYGQGDGQLGGGLACGGTYSDLSQRGVANRTLPCGSRVRLCVNHRCVTVRVVDRGPYAGGRDFDLMAQTARDLGLAFPWSGSLRFAIVRR